MSRPLLLLSVLCVTLGSVGCPPNGSSPCDTDEDCPEGRCRFGACRPVCEEDLDCGDRQLCQGGRCAPRPECAATSDCAANFTCTDGTCRCNGDGACALNQACHEGRCQTRPRCASTQDCPPPQRCEVTGGLCLPPCASSLDCAPGLDPQVALALYQCAQGTCSRRCVGDATCGVGLICQDGLCASAECDTFTDCRDGRYCTSATFGRCEVFTTCATDAECPQNHTCRAFPPLECPPGFPCEQSLCRELPVCFVDEDCLASFPGQPAGAAYCADRHCQPSTSCEASADCGADQACVASVCVPGGCRGHADCSPGEACIGDGCVSAPPSGDLAQLFLTPRRLQLTVGGSQRLWVVGFDLAGGSFPLAQADFEVQDAQGAPSTGVAVDAAGLVTALQAGTFRVQVTVSGAAVTQVEATVHVHPQVTAGRRVVVVDAASRAPLAGVFVQGCDAPSVTGPCPAPVSVVTDAQGAADFFGFTGGTASFSVASPEVRADGLPRYERVSVLHTAEPDLLVPLWPNPTQSATGFNAVISFNQVRSEGNYWLGFAAAAAGDAADADLRGLLGDTFRVSLPGLPQRVSLPGSLVLYTSPGLGIPNPVKERSLAFAQPGRRATVAFGGRTTSELVTQARSTDLLAYAGAFDYALQAFRPFAPRPLVPDAQDIDGDGLCEDAAHCPLGTESVPDYAGFTPLSFTPRYEQRRRTEVIVPDLPSGTDTAVVMAVQVDPESGHVPLGFTSRTGGQPGPDGARPVGPVRLRSGGARAGVEVGVPGLWALATQAASPGGAGAGVLLREDPLPVTAALPPFLPLPEGALWVPQVRTFSPAQPGWHEAASLGANLARVDLLGSENRHRVYFGVTGSQTQLFVPEGPADGGVDPAAEADARLRVTLLQVATPSPGGPREPALVIDAYSRWDAQ